MRRMCIFLILSFVVGCGGSSHTHLGEATGAICPENSSLTYENFGRPFMDKYCNSCHDSALVGDERQGAPSDHNLDTLEGIRASHPEHIDALTAAGPLAVNTAMPPAEDHEHGSTHEHATADDHGEHDDHSDDDDDHSGTPVPTEEERFQLGEWIACDMP